jgi:hypothetical protein
MDSRQLARVSTLLDEAVEDLETDAVFKAEQKLRTIARIREAQAILLGERPTHPEDN